MQRPKIAACTQLSLAVAEGPGSLWDLPQPTQAQVLRLLAALIAREVLAEEGASG